MKSNGAVELAIQVLSLPEGPTNKELQRQARAWLRGLSGEEYAKLRAEALGGKDETEADELRAYKYQLFRRMAFTDTEAMAYCNMRLNAPGVRRVIARRALLLKVLKRASLPRDMTFYEVARLEDAKVGRVRDISHEEVMAKLLGSKGVTDGRRHRAE